MSPPTRLPARSATGSAARWETIRYALDSTPRTARLCVILIAASLPPAGTIVMLFHH